MQRPSVYLGLGSNLENPRAQLLKAIETLARLRDSTLLCCSSLYRSVPMGPQDQADYLNAVVKLQTGLSAECLLDELQAIENAHGRVRSRHWGPRTLDLDILLYGDEVIDSQRLQVPHPGIAARNFVLFPLAEIAGDLEIPGFGNVMELREQCPASGIERLAEVPPGAAHRQGRRMNNE